MGTFHRRVFKRGRAGLPQGPWFYLLCPLPIFLCVMAFSWPHLQVVHLGYEFNRLQVEKSQLAQLNAELKVERARLRSLTRIEEIARKDLGMVDPTPGQLIWVHPSSKGKYPPQGD